MAALGINIREQRSKHVDEFRHQTFDYIVTVCDRVREVCAEFHGDPERIHWSFADPAAEEDPEERQRAFEQTAEQLMARIHFLLTVVGRGQRR